MAQLYDEREDAVPWVLDGYLAEGGLTLLVGAPKLGKTTLAYHLMVSVSLAEPFLSRDVRQNKVLVLALEEHRRDVIHRLVDHSRRDLSGLVRVEFGPLEFDKDLLHDIVSYIQQEDIGLIVIDTLHALWDISDERDASEVLRKGKLLLRAVRSTKAAWLCLGHTRKGGGDHGEEIRGSSALAGLVDIAISMKRTGAGDCQRRLDAITRYSDTPKSITIELVNGEYVVLGTPEEVSMAAKVEKFWSVLTDEGQTADQLIALSGLSKQDVSRSVHKLGSKCLRSGKGYKGDPYRYRRNSIRPAYEPMRVGSDETNQSADPAALGRSEQP